QLFAGLFQHDVTDRYDDAALLGNPDELTGEQHTPVGVQPSHQGFHPTDPTGLEVDDRLVVDAKLPSLEGAL
ncbi:hypothetical protein NIL11_27245, partial [Klebsiella pneumoniae]